MRVIYLLITNEYTNETVSYSSRTIRIFKMAIVFGHVAPSTKGMSQGWHANEGNSRLLDGGEQKIRGRRDSG